MFRKKSRKTPQNKSQKNSQKNPQINRLRPLAGLMAAGLSVPAFVAGQSVPFPTYVTGPQPNGSWVVSSGQVISPAGLQVELGIRVRAKAVALNPIAKSHTAAVLTMGASEAVEVIDTNTGVVLQDYITDGKDKSGSYSGITYSADGKHLVFSQDSSNVTIARSPHKACWKTTFRSACRRTILSSAAFRTALQAPMQYPAARSIVRRLLIPVASRSQGIARAPTPC